MLVRDTDQADDLEREVKELKALVYAYRTGKMQESHTLAK